MLHCCQAHWVIWSAFNMLWLKQHKHPHTVTQIHIETNAHTELLGKACHTHNTDSLSVSGDAQLPCMRRQGTEGHWWISISHTSNHGIDLSQPPFDLGSKKHTLPHVYHSSVSPPLNSTLQFCALMCISILFKWAVLHKHTYTCKGLQIMLCEWVEGCEFCGGFLRDWGEMERSSPDA